MMIDTTCREWRSAGWYFLLISPRNLGDVAVLEAAFVEGLRRRPSERRVRGLVEEDIQESILFRRD